MKEFLLVLEHANLYSVIALNVYNSITQESFTTQAGAYLKQELIGWPVIFSS